MNLHRDQVGNEVGRPHEPSRLDNTSSYNRLSSIILDLSCVISALSQVIWASTCSHIITSTTKDWELEPNYKKLAVDTLWLVCMSLAVVFEIFKPDFYQIYWTIQPPTINSDQILNGSRNCPFISHVIKCYFKKDIKRWYLKKSKLKKKKHEVDVVGFGKLSQTSNPSRKGSRVGC